MINELEYMERNEITNIDKHDYVENAIIRMGKKTKEQNLDITACMQQAGVDFKIVVQDFAGTGNWMANLKKEEGVTYVLNDRLPQLANLHIQIRDNVDAVVKPVINLFKTIYKIGNLKEREKCLYDYYTKSQENVNRYQVWQDYKKIANMGNGFKKLFAEEHRKYLDVEDVEVFDDYGFKIFNNETQEYLPKKLEKIFFDCDLEDLNKENIIDQINMVECKKNQYHHDLKVQIIENNKYQIEAAADYLFLNLPYYNGAPVKYGYAGENIIDKEIDNILIRLKNMYLFSDRLQGVHITNMDCKEVINNYDSPYTFFSLDVPYIYHCNTYGNAWEYNEEKELFIRLHNLKGKFILNGRSYFDNFYKKYRQAFRKDKMEEFTELVMENAYCMSRWATFDVYHIKSYPYRDTEEFFISNYPINNAKTDKVNYINEVIRVSQKKILDAEQKMKGNKFDLV